MTDVRTVELLEGLVATIAQLAGFFSSLKVRRFPATVINSTHHRFSMVYRPEIDGLRALAVTIVVLFHAQFE
ncbi:MAG: hypothetical protein P8H62_01715 [Henriciella sp.]|nr:hypothetical protein [Henriciella sp.]